MNLNYKADDKLTEQEYFDVELISDVKHELIDGYAYAMAGANPNPDRIASAIIRILGNHLENSPCEVFTSDMKVKVWEDFFYPDAMVVCNKTDAEYYTDSPLIIIEVLSKFTRRKDQVLKRQAYQSLPSLQEYVLIEQDFVEVEVCRRANHWQSEHYFLGDEVRFESIDLTVPVEKIYSRVVNEDMTEFLAQQQKVINEANAG